MKLVLLVKEERMSISSVRHLTYEEAIKISTNCLKQAIKVIDLGFCPFAKKGKSRFVFRVVLVYVLSTVHLLWTLYPVHSV